MSKPEDEPLGGKPVLPVPSQDAQRRAHPLFSRILAEHHSERSEEGLAAWQPTTPHDEPTRVVNRDSILVEQARRRRRHEPPPAPMSASATDPFSRLPDAFPEPLQALDEDEPTQSRRPFSAMHFASGRRYDSTLAFIQAMAGPLEQPEMPPLLAQAPSYFDEAVSYRDTPASGHMAVDATSVDDDELARLSALSEGTALGEPEAVEPTRITRPPPFAPMVRPSPPPRKGPEAIDQEALAAMVDTSMLIAQPDGSAAFEIAFDDEVFQNLACTIAVTPQGVIATFRASDINTRRLLEAEAGRLRVRLSERGLKVVEVRVE